MSALPHKPVILTPACPVNSSLPSSHPRYSRAQALRTLHPPSQPYTHLPRPSQPQGRFSPLDLPGPTRKRHTYTSPSHAGDCLPLPMPVIAPYLNISPRIAFTPYMTPDSTVVAAVAASSAATASPPGHPYASCVR